MDMTTFKIVSKRKHLCRIHQADNVRVNQEELAQRGRQVFGVLVS